jgi:hypothetical protein
LGIKSGSKVLLRSRGVVIVSRPDSPCTVLADLPLRRLRPEVVPARSVAASVVDHLLLFGGGNKSGRGHRDRDTTRIQNPVGTITW